MVKVGSLDKITQGMNRKKNVKSELCRGQGNAEICREASWGAAGNLRGNPDNMASWKARKKNVLRQSITSIKCYRVKSNTRVRNGYQICNMKVNDNFEMDGGDKGPNFDGLKEKGKKSAS